MKQFDRDGRCPICRRDFRSSDCPHSIADATKRIESIELDKRVTKIVRRELRKAAL